MEDHQKKQVKIVGYRRLLANIILTVFVFFLLAFMGMTIAAMSQLTFSSEEIVDGVSYCHENGLEVLVQRDENGKITGIQCDPKPPFQP